MSATRHSTARTRRSRWHWRPTGATAGQLYDTCASWRAQAARLEDEGDGEAAASLLVARWGRWLSVALHRANARGLRAALGGETARRARGEQLAADLAD